MKFEKPILEIHKFDLKDVISASGGGTEGSSETENPEGTPIWEDGGTCEGNHHDNYNYNNCW